METNNQSSLTHFPRSFMALKARTTTNWEAKQAKYKALKIKNIDKLEEKIAKRTACKDWWYGVLKAVQRFENFKESEDKIPFDVQMEHGHHSAKLHVMKLIRDNA